MDFSDEHYVKLFTRKTPTRQLWPWQARALHPNLMMVLTKAGVLDVGERDPVRGVAVMVDLPVEVVKPGLDALLEDGTVELVGGRLVMPKFLEAQESRKTKGAAMRDHREKVRDVARAKTAEQLKGTVTNRYQPLPNAIECNPPSPTPARPLPNPVPEKLPPPRKKRADGDPPDPRQPGFVKAVDDAFRQKRGTTYPFGPTDFGVIKRLLKRKPLPDALWPIALAAAWVRALDSSFPGCSTLLEFEKQLAKHIGTGPPAKAELRPRDEPVVYREGRAHL